MVMKQKQVIQSFKSILHFIHSMHATCLGGHTQGRAIKRMYYNSILTNAQSKTLSFKT